MVPETPEPEPRGSRLAILLLAATLAVGALGTAGCARQEASDPALADSTYVNVMARLALVRETGEGAQRIRQGEGFAQSADSLQQQAIDGVLREAGVEREALLDFARQVGDESDRMSDLWERIQAVSDSLRTEGWDPPGPLPPVDGPGGS